MLLAQPAVTGYVQNRVFKHRLLDKVDGTGRTAIVVKHGVGWASPDTVQTIEYPVLVLDVYADPSRLVTGEINVADAEDKTWSVYRTLDRLLHTQRDVWWGAVGSDPGLKVISCRRHSEPVLTTQDDQHAGAPPLGDSVYLSARYALEVVH